MNKVIKQKKASSAVRIKKNLSDSIRQEMAFKRITISGLAKTTRTNRNVIKRVLDKNNTSITLKTMAKAAEALGLELTLTAKPMSPQRLTDLTRRMADAPTDAEAKLLEDQIVAGFFGRPAPHA